VQCSARALGSAARSRLSSSVSPTQADEVNLLPRRYSVCKASRTKGGERPTVLELNARQLRAPSGRCGKSQREGHHLPAGEKELSKHVIQYHRRNLNSRCLRCRWRWLEGLWIHTVVYSFCIYIHQFELEAAAGTHDTSVTRPANPRDHRDHALRAQQVTRSSVPRVSSPDMYHRVDGFLVPSV
jgi:hypothetical protein